MVGSKFIIFYLHASGEDIKFSHKMLDLLRNLYQVSSLSNLDQRDSYGIFWI